jgi:hypothetical protein
MLTSSSMPAGASTQQGRGVHQCRRLQQHRSWGWSRSIPSRRIKVGAHLITSCAHLARTIVTSSQRARPVCHRCATPWPVLFPISKISRHSNGEAICAIRCTGRTPLITIVQHFPAWCLLSEGLGPPRSTRTKASTQKDRHHFAWRTRRRGCFFGLRSRWMLAHPPLAAKAGLPHRTAQQPKKAEGAEH